MFAGVDGLIKDQEWWLQDSNSIFANWNGYEGGESDGMVGTVSANVNANVGVDGMGNGLGNGMGNELGNTSMGNGMGTGMYTNNGAYGYGQMGNGSMNGQL